MQREAEKSRAIERGQGLVEYGLIIMLAGIVVIVGLAMFGDKIQRLYCEIVLSIAPDIDAPACNRIDVSCNVVSSSPFRLEAQVSDNAGDDDDITKVVFSVDGKPYNTEYHYKYCLQGGDGPCSNYTGAKGKHKFSAVATDAEGYTGSCTIETTLP
jgi:Flp pilus assembly pilin Flp